MIRKDIEQIKARHLRKKGFSLKEISSQLRVSKSSVSQWVRDVKLTKVQISFLKHKAFLKEIIKKRVATRLNNERQKREQVIIQHKKLLSHLRLDQKDLIFIGSALYWAEGGKSDKSRMFKFSNSDPEMIQVMINFLNKACKVPKKKLRGHIQIHPHLSPKKAEQYWSKISNIPLNQFYKTSLAHSRASKNTRDSLPFGTFNIEICSIDLYLKMLAWIKVVKEKVLQKNEYSYRT